ncbi:MAG: alpha/beta hydrolase [Saccharospirillaceae bacterium]|nr:alpha/beta hydrolase [Colwellia sp.]NRB77640.1 alpha/beta hydrolase [Saccharospirillaceae bacterium]
MKKIIILLSVLLTFTTHAETSKVNIGEFDISYEVSGQGKHVILMEAGMGKSLTTWDPIYNELTKTAKVIRYSRVGEGDSTKVKRQFSMSNSVQHLDKFLKALKVEVPMVLVAHSYGGLIVRKFAALYPERVKAILLIDPSSEHDLDIMRTIDLPQAIKEISFMKTMGIENGLDNSFLEYWSKRPMPNYPEIKDIPVLMIATIKKYTNPPMLLLTDKGREIMGQSHQSWAESFPQGRAVLTTNSYHHIHRDEPELVLKEFNKLLKALD